MFLRNPTPETKGPIEESQFIWPQLSLTNLTYAYISSNPDIRIDYRQKDFAFWAYYMPYITHGKIFEGIVNIDRLLTPCCIFNLLTH